MTVTVEAIHRGRNWEIVAVVRANRNEVADFVEALPIPAQKKIIRMFRIIADAEDGPFMFLKKTSKTPRAEIERARTVRARYYGEAP